MSAYSLLRRAPVLVGGLLLSAPLLAADVDPLDGIGGGKIVETVLGLAVVLLLIFALARLVQKAQGSVQSGGPSLRIISSMSLGTREKIMLLHVADKQILVGVTAQAIAALHVFEEALPVTDTGTSTPSSGHSFTALLQSLTPAQSGGRQSATGPQK